MSTLYFFFSLLFLLASQSHSHSHSFLIPLSHTLPLDNYSSLHHLLKTSTLRSTNRHRHRHLPDHHHHHHHHHLSLPLSSGSDYTLSLSLGPTASPTTVSLFMDTGSDLVWFPCSPFSCILCEGKSPPNSPPPPPPPQETRLVSCSSPSCSAAHSSLPSSDLCAAAACPLDDIETSSCHSHPCPPLYYAYGDGSLLAHLRRGRLSFSPNPNPISLPNFTFACAHSALAEPVGVAGFGRGPLSLPAQLAALNPSLASRFSYCLVAHSFLPDRLLRPSPLILGRAADPDHPDLGFVYTPLLPNPKHPYFYSVALEAVSIGSTRIRTRPDLASVDRSGNGGMVVDSGTTFTMLPTDTYSLIAAEFDKRMTKSGFDRAVETENQTGLKPCYYYLPSRSSGREVPGLALHFKGNATVALPRRNYFMGFKSEGKSVGCLMLMDGGGGDGDEEEYSGPAGTLGNFQQQGFEVVYDLEGGRVGFARRRCTALWDELARG
ncbi:probable aspartyl protease At4g16563 [Typha latifolia]|uniref:probable aspartyl protease At4g16563 n=1 Tax=Typha latifolia TaxID=4733 RepID=UPI003C2EEC9C